MDLRPSFRRRDGYVLLVETDDSRRVVTANEAAAKARRGSEPCPPPVEVATAALRRVKKLGGNLNDKVFVMIFTQSL